MKLDTSDYYPWGADKRRPADTLTEEEAPKEETEIPSEESAFPEAKDPEGEKPDSAAAEKENAEEAQPPQAPEGLMTLWSHFMSIVFSPIVVPTYGIIAVFMLSMFSYAPAASKWIITGIVFGITGVIPAAAIYVLTKFGDVKDMALTRRSDRLFPYIITAACLLACGFYLTKTGLPGWVGYFYIGAGIATVINLIVNFFWKISAHGAGIGGLIAMFVILNHYGLPSYNLWGWVIAAVIVAGLLGTARVWLWRHTPMQTIAGEIVGFLSVILTEAFLN